MVLDHIGIVVKSLERGIEVWRQVFCYDQATSPVINSRQQVRVVFLRKEDSVLIKLIEPTDPTSPIFAMAAWGGGLHHLGFRRPSIVGAQEAIRAAGGRTLVEPQPGEAFDNELIAFSYLYGVPPEIIETEKKASPIAQPSSFKRPRPRPARDK